MTPRKRQSWAVRRASEGGVGEGERKRSRKDPILALRVVITRRCSLFVALVPTVNGARFLGRPQVRPMLAVSGTPSLALFPSCHYQELNPPLAQVRCRHYQMRSAELPPYPLGKQRNAAKPPTHTSFSAPPIPPCTTIAVIAVSPKPTALTPPSSICSGILDCVLIRAKTFLYCQLSPYDFS